MLTACLGRTPEPTVVTQTEYVSQNIPTQERPKKVEMPPVEWYVVTEENLEQKIEELKEDELPDEFKNKTAEEKIKLVEQKKQEREKYQEEISNLAKERQKFIDEELKKRANEGDVDDFGTSVNESILNKAKEIGYQKTLK